MKTRYFKMPNGKRIKFMLCPDCGVWIIQKNHTKEDCLRCQKGKEIRKRVSKQACKMITKGGIT